MGHSSSEIEEFSRERKDNSEFYCKCRNNFVYPNCSFSWILLHLTPELTDSAVDSLAVTVPGTLALCVPEKLGCLPTWALGLLLKDCTGSLSLPLTNLFTGEEQQACPCQSWNILAWFLFMVSPFSDSPDKVPAWEQALVPTEVLAHDLPCWQLCCSKCCAALTNQPLEGPVGPVPPSFFLPLSEAQRGGSWGDAACQLPALSLFLRL